MYRFFWMFFTSALAQRHKHQTRAIIFITEVKGLANHSAILGIIPSHDIARPVRGNEQVTRTDGLLCRCKQRKIKYKYPAHTLHW